MTALFLYINHLVDAFRATILHLTSSLTYSVHIITKDGQHIGAIGISGANPELDGICAKAGLDAIEREL